MLIPIHFNQAANFCIHGETRQFVLNSLNNSKSLAIANWATTRASEFVHCGAKLQPSGNGCGYRRDDFLKPAQSIRGLPAGVEVREAGCSEKSRFPGFRVQIQ
jgi:hypothetical protein